MRTTKKERKDNFMRFYEAFLNGNSRKAAIVIERTDSSNPNIQRCRFWAVPSSLAYHSPVVIAESTFGISGCFIEMLGFIKPEICAQKTFFEDGFNDWLKRTFHFSISHNDGLVLMLEK